MGGRGATGGCGAAAEVCYQAAAEPAAEESPGNLVMDIREDDRQRELHLHRTVVAMRSPVFSAQFFGSLAYEAGGGGHYVRIHDMKPAAFEAVLHFIYTDMLPPVEDLDFLRSGSAYCAELRETAAGCSQEGLREMVGDWLAAADRYDLERMRLMCENALCETISVENAAATLKLADRHHCPQLKAFCMDYIVSPAAAEPKPGQVSGLEGPRLRRCCQVPWNKRQLTTSLVYC